ncbi:hypothetical protein OIE52_39370 [Streptomyces canus]
MPEVVEGIEDVARGLRQEVDLPRAEGFEDFLDGDGPYLLVP